MQPDDLFDEARFRPTEADALPATDLTELFVQASTSSAYALEFYRRLLLETLAVLVEQMPDSLAVGSRERVSLTLLNLPTGELPVFTSRARVFENASLDPATTPVVGINGRELLTSLTDQAVVINPFSTPSLVLPPSIISQLVSGDYLRRATESQELTAEESEAGAQIGLVPAEHAELAAQLSQQLALVLRQQPRARRAYLVWQVAAPGNPDSGFLVLLSVDGDSQRIAQEISFVGRDLLRASVPLNIVVAQEVNYFQEEAEALQVAPFYEE